MFKLICKITDKQGGVDGNSVLQWTNFVFKIAVHFNYYATKKKKI